MNQDRIRQIVVTVAGALCVLGTLVGTGVLGTEVEDSAGGAFNDEATLLAPAGPAFSIWSVIYAGLAAYVVWQWLPGRTTDPRLRATGYLAAASLVLNGAWLLVVQEGWVWGSVAVIVALVLVLGLLVDRLAHHRTSGHDGTDTDGAAGWLERVVVDGTFGLYLGWVMIATVANVAAALVDSGVETSARTGEIIGAVVLVVVAAAVVGVNARVGGRVAVALASTWGLAWIAYGRASESPESTITAITAAVAAVVVLASALPGARRVTRAAG